MTYRVPTQVGKLAVVTGATSGTGEEAALRLAGAGAHVILAVRNADKGEATKTTILTRHPEAEVEVRVVDLASLASVRAFVEGMIATNTPVDLLLNNAGVMAPAQRLETEDGFELQFATNFLGHFALTLGLLPLLLSAAGPVVTTMSSSAAAFGTIRFNDPQYTKRYSPFLSYAQSKLADLLFANQLAVVAKERSWDLMSNAAHPGFTRTNLLAGSSAAPRKKFMEELMFLPSQGVEQGTEPMLFAATSPDAISGAYYGPKGFLSLRGATTRVKAPRRARNEATQKKLWTLAETLTGARLPDEIVD